MKKFTLFPLLIILVPTITIIAQEGECSTIVEEALTIVGDACAEIGRNQACYGNTTITATTWEDAELKFSTPGDLAEIIDISSLATSPLSIDESIWGIALLALQANLPGSMPGQNVTFVLFGDVTLENEVEPDEVVIIPTLTATATGNINIRTGPGTDFVTAGGLANGQEIIVDGRNEAGDWLQFTHNGQEAWVFASLMNVDGDVNELIVASTDNEPGLAPMQAFHLTTGIGETKCKDVPLDGIMIQAPTDTIVNFMINGIEVEIGSTALLRLNPDSASLKVANLQGNVVVRSGGDEVTLDVAEQTEVTSGTTPSQPQGYTYDDVRGLPVDLLPERVIIVPPGRSYLTACFFRDSGNSIAQADDTLSFDIVLLDTDENINQMLNENIVLTFDGEPVELWGAIGPATFDPNSTTESHRVDWIWVIDNLQSGQHTLKLSEWGNLPLESLSCNITVN